jgi:protein ImuA
VRHEAEASAAWTRWRIAPAPSQAQERELGPPAYALELIRNRAGPAGARFTVEWNAYARCFENLARDPSAASQDRPADPIRARA